MAIPISQSSLRLPIEGGVRVSQATIHESEDTWVVPPAGASWLGMSIPKGVLRITQAVYVEANTFEPVWHCAWYYGNNVRQDIKMSTEVPPQERITAALVAMRMQHGNDSKVEGGGTP